MTIYFCSSTKPICSSTKPIYQSRYPIRLYSVTLREADFSIFGYFCCDQRSRFLFFNKADLSCDEADLLFDRADLLFLLCSTKPIFVLQRSRFVLQRSRFISRVTLSDCILFPSTKPIFRFLILISNNFLF